jgi:S-adenosylmethionine hydrolase
VRHLLLYVLLSAAHLGFSQSKIVVFQTDFGLKDGAVAAMKGVAMSVSSDLRLFDLTHEIPAYNIWEAAYRLEQTATYWPKGTVFVSVVDPGVGTARRSVVLQTKSGHFFVGPDNGSFTLVAETLGIAALREINEAVNRRKNSTSSYTFHGRDVYAYTAARLAAGTIRFEQVGQKLPHEVVKIDYPQPTLQTNRVSGNIPVLDIQYGNVWTNISATLFQKLGLKAGDNIRFKIYEQTKLICEGTAPIVNTFGEVPEGAVLCYFNSLMNVSLAINMGSFAQKYGVQSGPTWQVIFEANR